MGAGGGAQAAGEPVSQVRAEIPHGIQAIAILADHALGLGAFGQRGKGEDPDAGI